MQSIFSSAAQPETSGSSWLIAESTDHLASVADAERLYATELPALLPEEWPLL
jgi:hypothetical protein